MGPQLLRWVIGGAFLAMAVWMLVPDQIDLARNGPLGRVQLRLLGQSRQGQAGASRDNAGVNPPDTHTLAVIDFETTGMSPALGARATEIAVVLLRDGRIVDRYASLMHSGAWVPPFIEQLTGISNRMLASAPPARQVMREVAEFTAGCPVVAHNASFDRSFWLHEHGLADSDAAVMQAPFACTLLLSRRLYPQAPNHKLGTLAQWHGITPIGRAHRALADAEMAAGLWQRIVQDVQARHAAEVPFGLLCLLQRTPRQLLDRAVTRYFAEAGTPG